MSEEGTAVLEKTEEETTPGGLFTKQEFEDLKKGIDEIAASRDDSIPRETEPAASDAPPEPEEATPADEPSRTPEPAALPEADPVEPEVPEPAEPAPEKADEESPAAGFDDLLLARAEQMGFSKQAAESFGTPDKLETALTVLDQRLIGTVQPKAPPAPQAPAQQVAPAVPAAPVVQAPPVQPVADSFVIDLDPDEHSLEIVEQFKKLHSHYEGRANQFEQAFAVLVTAIQSGQQRSDLQVVNQSIDGLNGNMKGLITPEIRAQIHPTAIALASALSQNGLPVPSIPQLVTRAAQSLLSEQLLKNEHKRATDEISEKLDKRASQRTARPVQHRSAEPGLTKKEKKEQSVKDVGAYMRERGMR